MFLKSAIKTAGKRLNEKNLNFLAQKGAYEVQMLFLRLTVHPCSLVFLKCSSSSVHIVHRIKDRNIQQSSSW